MKNIIKDKFIFLNFFIGLLFSLFIVHISAGLRILNPSYSGWLSIGDGRGAISWDFFRNTSFPDWVLGQIPSYGLEMSRPLLYHVPAFYMYPMRFISSLLPEEFQFIGWVILINLILQYIFSFKIFWLFIKNKLIAVTGSLILTLTPFFLDRFIVHDHYFLLNHWLILLSFYLILKKNLSFFTWTFLFGASVLIFPYFTAMLLPIYFTYLIYSWKFSSFSLQHIFKNLFGVLGTLLVTLLAVGYSRNSSSSDDSGLGLFRANLLTFFDSSGWSRILPDLPQTYGDYEGFAFLGIATFLFGIPLIISFLNSKKRREMQTYIQDFAPIIIASILLFVFSLSTDIALGAREIFDFNYPSALEDVAASFRSTGRFAWPLAYLLIFITYILFFRIYNYKFLKFLAVIILFVQLFDSYPKITSNKHVKFSMQYKSPLTSPFWNEISECYTAIHQLPAVLNSRYHYDFAKASAKNSLGIFPIPTDRFGTEKKLELIRDSRNLIRTAKYDINRLYVFREGNFFLESELLLDQNLALNTLPRNTRAGYVDGFLVVAPDIYRCENFSEKYKNLLSLESRSDYQVTSTKLNFTRKLNNSSVLINGWSTPEPWGVWSVDNWTGIFMQTEKIINFKQLRIQGHGFKWPSGFLPSAEIFLNGVYLGDLSPQNNKLQEYIFLIPSNLAAEKNYYLEFRFDKVDSPSNLGSGDDSRNLGFMFKELELE